MGKGKGKEKDCERKDEEVGKVTSQRAGGEGEDDGAKRAALEKEKEKSVTENTTRIPRGFPDPRPLALRVYEEIIADGDERRRFRHLVRAVPFQRISHASHESIR